MPDDPNGNYSLPGVSIVSDGQTALATQHNSPLQDMAQALTARLSRNGAGGMLGNFNVNGFRVTNVATPSASTDAVTKAYADALLPIGMVVDFAGQTPPAGWLLCYGQAVSRTTYAALFSLMGTIYGAGDGSTTFNLPDLRGRVVAGKDDMGGVSADRLTNQSGGLNGDTLGATGGSETHTLTTAQMPNHSHTASVTDPGHSHTVLGWTNSLGGIAAGAGVGYYQSIATSHSVTGISVSIGATGSGQAHNNAQPTIILNKIIKAL